MWRLNVLFLVCVSLREVGGVVFTSSAARRRVIRGGDARRWQHAKSLHLFKTKRAVR